MLPAISADEAALLRAVCLDPWDDLPRLVIADWYEEHGQTERAEMIRTQCAVRREGTTLAKDLAADAVARFVVKHGGGPEPAAYGELAARLRVHVRGWWQEVEFHRWEQYEAAAAGLWGRAPVVRVSWPGFVVPRDVSGATFSWARGGFHAILPRVFDRMARLASPRPVGPADAQSQYTSVAAARETLSRACVDEGRAAAGLPPLAWPAFVDPVA